MLQCMPWIRTLSTVPPAQDRPQPLGYKFVSRLLQQGHASITVSSHFAFAGLDADGAAIAATLDLLQQLCLTLCTVNSTRQLAGDAEQHSSDTAAPSQSTVGPANRQQSQSTLPSSCSAALIHSALHAVPSAAAAALACCSSSRSTVAAAQALAAAHQLAGEPSHAAATAMGDTGALLLCIHM